MLQILSKMFEFFQNKTKRIQIKIDKYIELENERQIIKSDIDELADFFSERKTVRDSIMKSETDQEIRKSVDERYDNFVSAHIFEIGDLKRRRDVIEKSMNNLIKGDDEFLNLVEKEKENRKFKSILSKYRSNDIDLNTCDTLIKAISKKKVNYADNLVFNDKGELLLLKRSEIVDFNPGYYTLPGGHVDQGEDFEIAAKRELLEEAGIKSEEVTEIGEYENEDVCIHYFRSDVKDTEPVLQEEEIWSYEWCDPKELDKYLMMDNMRDNIVKMMFPVKHQIITIKKSLENGLINEKVYDVLIGNILEKAKSGIYKLTEENKKLGRVGQKYGQKKEKNKYQKIKDYAEQVIRGEKHIERLSPEEEQSRIEGGKINVEATIILGTSKKTESELPQRDKQLKLLELIAKKSGYWIDDYKKKFGVENKLDKATESEVFYDKDSYVFKVNNFSQHEDISEMFDRVALQNLLFPDTKYEVIGFTKREDEVNVVLKQPFVEMKVDEDGVVLRPSKKELSEEMKKLGYEDQGGNMFSNDNYIIEDLHSGNVCFSKEGKIMFIDPVIRVNLISEGYGGKRELGEIKLEKSEEQDIEKAKSFKNDKTKDDISVDKFFENKFEDKYKNFYEAVKKYLYDKWGVKTKKEFDDKFSEESKLKEVDIDDIIPTQKYVSKKIMEEKMDNDHFKTSKIQLLKFDSNYYLFDGHHRTSVMIEEGYDTVKEEVLKLNKIKDFEKDIEKYLPEDYDLYDIVDKAEDNDIEKSKYNTILGDYGDEVIEKLKIALSKDKKYEEKLKKLKERRDPDNIENWNEKAEFINLNKAFEENFINETQYSILLEKAWKKQQIGTVVTHKDGKKYRKVSETGNKDQDWKLVSKDKTGTAKPESNGNSEAKQQESVDNKPSKKELQESAKNTSETALTNAVKQSPDPEVRQTAHEELQRREEEEKSKEEKDKNKFIKNKGLSGKVELVDLKELKINPNEQWSKDYEESGFGKQYTDKIAESLKKGVKMPAIEVKRSDNTIIDGQHRYKAAIKAGLTKIGVQYYEDKKETQKSEEVDIEKAKDHIKGGLSDNLSIEQIAEKHGVSVKKITKQIKKGVKVEMEHTDDKQVALEIARDHICEFSDYYTRLEKMENEAKKENKEDE